VAALSLAALVSSATLAAQDVPLRYRWTKGEEVRYRTTQQMDMQMTGLPGMGDMNIGMTTVQINKFNVEDVAADGTATLRNTFESIKISMAVPMMGEVAYDSANPSAAAGNPISDALAKTLGAMAGETITMVVAPHGKVGKIDGLAKLVEKMKAGASAGLSSMGLGGADAMMTEDGQRATLEQTFSLLPEKPIKVGETWKNSYTMPGSTGGQTVAVTYTLKAQETTGGSAIARIASTGTSKGSAAPGNMGPMTVTVGDGASTGETLFDVKAGRVRKATGTMSLPMTMRMSAPDGTDISLQAAQKVTTTMELIEK
jgi:hypothetical protein